MVIDSSTDTNNNKKENNIHLMSHVTCPMLHITCNMSTVTNASLGQFSLSVTMSVCLSLGLLVPSVADQKTAVDFFLVEETICVNKPTVHSGEVALGGSVAVAVVDR